MTAIEIKTVLLRHGFKLWHLAQCIGITQSTLSIWMRQDLSGEREARVRAALEELTGGDKTCTKDES